MGNDRAEREKRAIPSPTNKPGRGKDSSNYTPVTWVSYTFTPAQKEELRKTEFDLPRAIDFLAHLVDQGHKVSINPKTRDGFIGVSVWGHTETCSNKGFGVSGEGGNLYAALRAVVAKLDYLDGILGGYIIQDEDDFR